MHVNVLLFNELPNDKELTHKEVMQRLFAFVNDDYFDYFDEDTLELYTGKEVKKQDDAYYLQEGFHGIVCRETEPVTFQKLLRSIPDDYDIWKVDVHI